MKKTAIAYWLIPAKDKRQLFCEIIRILYREFDAPNFDPHLTLFVDSKKGNAPAKVLRQIKAAPIRMSTGGIGFSPKFTKTLFVRFKSSRAFEKLVVDLARATNSPAKSIRDPHVSLLYKNLPTATKKELAATIRLPFREVVFDSISAVRCVLPVRGRTEVEAWRKLATKKL
jgi:2'-5' RNA ligase